MALYVITGKEAASPTRPEGHFIPRRARFGVFSVPHEHKVAGGITTGKEIPIDVDAGRYRYKIWKPGVANFGGEFYAGMTAEEWARMESRSLSWAKVDHTTEGPRWTCKLCKETNMTKAGAIQHEWTKHLGLDPTKATDEDIDDATSAPQPMANRAVTAGDDEDSPIPPITKRGPGRPRKDAAEA